VGVFLGLVIIVAFFGAFAGGFYTGMVLTRSLASQVAFGEANSSRLLRRFGAMSVWCVRILVSLVMAQVFVLPFWLLALVIGQFD
jgi:hypothetical protein